MVVVTPVLQGGGNRLNRAVEVYFICRLNYAYKVYQNKTGSCRGEYPDGLPVAALRTVAIIGAIALPVHACGREGYIISII